MCARACARALLMNWPYINEMFFVLSVINGVLQKWPRRLGPMCGRSGAAPGSPALAQPGYAAVVFVPTTLVEHAGMHDVADGHVKVVGEEVLDNF